MENMSSTLLTNSDVLDVVTGSVKSNCHIHIENGIIKKIYDDEPSLDSTEVIDIKGNIVIPGLIDAHIHVNAIAANLNNLRFQPQTYVVPQAMQLMEAMLMRGFTTVRDAAGADWGIAKAVEEGYIKSPRIIFGGAALSPSGGHGDSRSASDHTGPYPHGTDLSILCDGVPQVRKACRDLIRTGAHHIKIMASGGVASPTDRIDSLQFSKEEIMAIVEEAEAANIYVLAHAYTAKAVNRALRLGVRSIEHANLLNAESVELFLKHDAYLVPTLITYFALKEEGLQLGLPQASYEKVDSVLENGKSAIKMAYEGGVKMVFGTDLLGHMQRRQLEEFKLLSELMTPLDIIQTATINAADLLQMRGSIGEVIEGAYADILAYDTNPLENLDVLQHPEKHLKLIMKVGKVFKNQI